MAIQQTSGPCDWCGTLVLIVPVEKGRPLKYDPLIDEQNRLLRAYDGNLIAGKEHHCRAKCSVCGAALIFDSGILYERSTTTSENFAPKRGKIHYCSD